MALGCGIGRSHACWAVFEILGEERSDLLTDDGFRAGLARVSWRMPLQAIAHHARGRTDGTPGALQRVVVIGSSDRQPGDGTGTVHHFKKFRDLVGKLRQDDPNASEFSISDLHGLIRKYRVRVVKDYSNGVDFEKPSELEEAVYHAFLALNQSGIPDEDILVDVTGGQKPLSIAGAVVALAKQRRIQYISTHDYRVRVYDVEFES